MYCFDWIFKGETACDKYKAVPTEWPNLMKPDVVYEPKSKKDRQFPPMLVEILHTVDLKFYLRINEYCLQMLKSYPVPPIVVVIAINTTTQDILNLMEITNPDVMFASRLPSTCWAKPFHLLNAGTIRPYPAEPLDPLVAVAHFLIEQKQSLISMELREDTTIQMLFRFAKEIFGGDIGKYDNIVNTLQYVCTSLGSNYLKQGAH